MLRPGYDLCSLYTSEEFAGVKVSVRGADLFDRTLRALCAPLLHIVMFVSTYEHIVQYARCYAFLKKFN